MPENLETKEDLNIWGFTPEQSEWMIRRMETALKITVLPHIDAKFDEVIERLDGVIQRLDGLNARFDEVNGRLDGVNGRLDDMKVDTNQKFDSIDKGLKRVTTIISITFGALALEFVVGFGIITCTQASLLAKINLLLAQMSPLLGGN